MQKFGKKKFLQKIKQALTNLESVRLGICIYNAYPFSEWLEFEYGNYYYVFYHAEAYGENTFKYRKRYFDAFANKQTGPYEVHTLNLKNVS